MLAFLSFIGSPIGKIVTYICSVLVVSGTLWIVLLIHDRHIAQQAEVQFNQKQLEQVVKDQQTYIQNTEKLKEDSAKQTDLLQAQSKTLDKKLSGADNYLATLPLDVQQVPSSTILKNTFKQLEDNQ